MKTLIKIPLLIFPSVFVMSCGSLPIDATPDWASNNRFGIEMTNDCNLTRSSIGLGGCAFYDNQIGGNLILPSLWSGMLTFTAYNCTSFTQVANLNDNILPIKNMYTDLNKDNCAFDIVRTVTEQDISAYFSMIGRFFIKIIPYSKNYTKMKFKVNSDNFEGVGWFQRKYGKEDAKLEITTLDTNGMFMIKCGEDIVKQFNYTTNKFFVEMDSSENCDYELAANSKNLPFKELGTYMHVVNKYTVDLSVPSVSISDSKITFTFNDKDSSGKNPVVIGVQVEATKCKNTNKCTVVNNKARYYVKAITPSTRPFYQIYTVATKTWENRQ